MEDEGGYNSRVKDEKPYDLVRTSNNGAGSDRGERRTPASDKEARRTPHGGGEFDQRSRHTPSPAPTPGSSASAGGGKGFPSDSTTDVGRGGGGGPPQDGPQGLLVRGVYPGRDGERVRRHSDANSGEGDNHERSVVKYNDFRGSRDDLDRGQSPPRNGE